MSKKRLLVALFTVILVLTGCGPGATPTDTPLPPPPTEPPTPTPTTPLPATPTPVATQEGLLISEVLPGILGVNNNLEFIELYNAGTEATDLQGWALWYRVADGRDEQLIFAWNERADIPGHGHYLLVRAGQDVGNLGDAQYTTSLFEKKGGLALRNAAGETVDTLVWGEGPADYLTGSPATVPEGGASLERLPGGAQGNGFHSGDDASDFAINPSPSPQNIGDPATPLPSQRLAIHLDAPQEAEPGNEWLYSVEVQNLSGVSLIDLRAWIPVPEQFEVVSLPASANQSAGWIEWTLAELANGETKDATIVMKSPWTYLSTLLRGAYVESSDGLFRAYGPVQSLTITGGVIPVATARTLKGETVTVEGVASMYTDGFYAGSTGTKFYLEDESGGIQVYCPDGKGSVNVSVGDRVRVTGEIDVYRDSIEIIPSTYPDDVKVLERGGAEPEPTFATLEEASGDENLLGRLIVVEGNATRIEEFTYSYEIDLMDDEGNILLVYVEKDAGLTAEPLDVGSLHQVTGISELYDGIWQIKPRFQTDFAEVFPPELMMEMNARNRVEPGGMITYTLTAYNHTDVHLTNITIEATPPADGISVATVLDDGVLDGPTIVWTIPKLAGGGASAAVRYAVTVKEGVGGPIAAAAAAATADEWQDPVETDPLLTFVGSAIPIWAIQGRGMASPYVRDQVTTEGIVIGIFPELEGFWIQEPETDDDPNTSSGLFILTAELEPSVALGDRVRVSGQLRERSGQTLLEIVETGDVEVITTGNQLPPAVELDPPLQREEAQAYYEALEGMLVEVGNPAIAVAPTTKYGESVLVRPEWGIKRIMKGDPTGMTIFVDDGSSATHYDLSTLPFALQTGDLLAGVLGPLAYTFDNYKIEPIALPVITPDEQPLPSLEPAGANELSIATFNVEDLFDSRDPHPSDTPLPRRSEYQLDLTKTANAIVAMGAPTIVGLQEVENIDILEELAQQDALADYEYQVFLVEGTDSRGIDVGYLVRVDRAIVEAATAYPAPEGLTSRPPLLITVTVQLQDAEQTFYVINNHFTSMSGGEKPTEPRRKAQAAWNVTLVERILADDPKAYVVVLGDLNSFYDSPPLDVLREAGLQHVYELVEPERPYTYIYLGESETLDHILVTPSLYQKLVQVTALHINADYPPPIPDDPSAQRTSDHDPLVVVFSLR
jgi:predicted extracellular nuclease